MKRNKFFLLLMFWESLGLLILVSLNAFPRYSNDKFATGLLLLLILYPLASIGLSIVLSIKNSLKLVPKTVVFWFVMYGSVLFSMAAFDKIENWTSSSLTQKKERKYLNWLLFQSGEEFKLTEKDGLFIVDRKAYPQHFQISNDASELTLFIDSVPAFNLRDTNIMKRGIYKMSQFLLAPGSRSKVAYNLDRFGFIKQKPAALDSSYTELKLMHNYETLIRCDVKPIRSFFKVNLRINKTLLYQQKE